MASRVLIKNPKKMEGRLGLACLYIWERTVE